MADLVKVAPGTIILIGDDDTIAVSFSDGTHNHANNTDEQDITDLIFLANKDKIEVAFDFTNLVNNTTLRIYEKIKGGTYIEQTAAVYPTDFSAKGGRFELVGKGHDQKITIQSGTAEGSIKDVDYDIVTEVRKLFT